MCMDYASLFKIFHSLVLFRSPYLHCHQSEIQNPLPFEEGGRMRVKDALYHPSITMFFRWPWAIEKAEILQRQLTYPPQVCMACSHGGKETIQ